MRMQRSKLLGFILSTLFVIALVRGDVGEQEKNDPPNLTKDTFDVYLATVPAEDGLLMEFYAHWCPACQHFAPAYEKVAKYFNSKPKVKPAIAVARVDCADETVLCGKFDIGKYPTMKYGLPQAFQEEHRDQLQELPNQRNAADIIAWLGTQKGVEYNFNASAEEQTERVSHKAALAASDPETPPVEFKEADLHDMEKATTLAIKYALGTPGLLVSKDSRLVLKEFMAVVSRAHAIERVGATKMLKAMSDPWLQGTDSKNDDLSKTHICGADAEQKDWRMCKGSKENKRGYTCGLWTVFHSLAARMQPEELGGSVWMSAIRGYVANFFQCSDCAKHFGEMAAEKEALGVKSRREGVMWAWRAHNEVNRRLEAEEKISGDGDPAFPKFQWPSMELCPLCRLPQLDKSLEVPWNEDEVYRFLLKFYNGVSEPQWVSQKLKAGTEMLGLSGRKGMAGSTESSKHHSYVGRYLVFGLLIGVLLFVARQRSSQKSGGRKIVSL